MAWKTYQQNDGMFRVCWFDTDGRGMTIGENLSVDEPDIQAIYKSLKDVGTAHEGHGFYWNTQKEATAGLRLVKAAEKAWKEKQPVCCPTCKRPLEKS